MVGIGTLQHRRLVCGPLLVSQVKVLYGLFFFAKLVVLSIKSHQNFFRRHKKPPLSFQATHV